MQQQQVDPAQQGQLYSRTRLPLWHVSRLRKAQR